MPWIVLLVFVPVIAWGMWLTFCRSIAKMHGVEGLKATPPIAKAFPVTQWVASLRHVGTWLTELLGSSNQQLPPPPPPPQRPALPPGPDGPPPSSGPPP